MTLRTCLLACCTAAVAISALHSETVPQPVPSVNTAADEGTPFVLPDGRLCFSRFAAGRSTLYVADSAQTTAKGLIPVRGNRSYTAFLPNGTALQTAWRVVERQPVMEILEIPFRDGHWGEAAPATRLNGPAGTWSGHQSASPDGSTVVFSSNRGGGSGKMDLWLSRKEESGEWEDPVNLGDMVNSPDDELSPFLISSDSLLFSSNGFGGRGGFELFLSVLRGGVWSPPEPLRTVNSEADELDPCYYRGRLVFASNRDNNNFDLYAERGLFEAPPAAQPEPATLDLLLNASAAEVVARTLVVVREFPLLPYVFFRPGSTDPLYLSLARADTAALPAQQDSVYAAVLDVVGARMKAMPETRLILRGFHDTRSQGENTELAQARAASVARYLKDTWAIAEERLEVMAGELPPRASSLDKTEGLSENRRVECIASHPSLLAPVRLQRAETELTPTSLRIDIQSRPSSVDGVASVRLSSPEKSSASIDISTANPSPVVFDLSQGYINDKVQTITVEAVAKAPGYYPTTVQRTLPVQKISITRSDASADVEQHRLVLFNYNSAELDSGQYKAIDYIAQKLNQNDYITVTGSADATGTPDFNAALARKRAENVAQALQQRTRAKVQVDDAVLVDSQAITPPQRFYARTVLITVRKGK